MHRSNRLLYYVVLVLAVQMRIVIGNSLVLRQPIHEALAQTLKHIILKRGIAEETNEYQLSARTLFHYGSSHLPVPQPG